MTPRLGARLRFLEVGLALAVIAVIVRAAQIQIVQRGPLAEEAERQRRAREVLPARRGALLDRHGVPLAVSHEYYHVGVAPNEVGGRRLTIHALVERLDLNQADLERAFAGDKRYLYFHGPFTAEQVQPLRRLPGIHLESEYRRFYPAGGLARPVIGAIAPDGDRGISGLELSLDSILSGEPGEAVVLKDRAGRIYESPSRVVREPLAGLDVTLTLDAELQDIAEQGLNDAIRDMRADGGDVVFLDPRSGELLALASHQADAADPAAFRPSTLTDPFEPGSTAKLFTAAALLTHRLVDSNDRVFAEHGEWNMVIPARGKPLVRKIRDVHASPGSLTLAQAIQVSSNIAMAKFSLRLAPESQYEMLRDFGFGSPSGAEFPAETRGRLNRPDRWRAQISGPSLAMGYEFGVTPVQLAAAYGAIANDGILLTPALVQSIRDPEGGLLYRHRPEPVRRVVSPEVAATLRGYLRGAVSEGGTGERAQLVNYTLLGKTGTALRFEGGRYVPGEYTASFAALFPAEDPQLVVIVKIENPKAIYGGLTAAPVTRRMLDQALAARRVAIDRSRLVGREQVDSTAPPAEAPAGEEPERDSAGQVVVVPWPPAPVAAMPPVRVLVPDVRGFNVRKAALALHRRGFRVVLRGQGRVVRTEPAGADSAQRGGAVTVWASDE